MLNYEIIVAVSIYGAIGKDGKIPWKQKTDMKRFRKKTTGHIVVMGRKTFESMGSKPLPNRLNIVVSTSMKPGDFQTYVCCNSIEAVNDLINRLRDTGDTRRVFIIGGSGIYKAFEPYASLIHFTVIDCDVPDADAHYHPSCYFKKIGKPEAYGPSKENGDQHAFFFHTLAPERDIEPICPCGNIIDEPSDIDQGICRECR